MHAPSSLPEMQTLARRLGVGFTVIASLMSAAAGWRFGGDSLFASVLLAALLGGLTVAVAIMLTFIDAAWQSGERGVAGALAGIMALLVVGEYASHVAFGTAHRAANIETAQLQTVRYDDMRDQVRDDAASVAMWSKRIADLEAANAWVTTVTADSLRAEVAAEKARGGCGPKCRGLEARLAVAEETANLRKQIEGSKRALAAAREKAAGASKGDSVALNQSSLFATAATGSLAPSAAAIAWANIGIGAYLAFISTALGCVFNWLGFHTFGGRSGGRVGRAPREAEVIAAPRRVEGQGAQATVVREVEVDSAFAALRSDLRRTVGAPA